MASPLSEWPPKEQKTLQTMIETHKDSGAFAVFDADNTIWKNDITEALLAYYDTNNLLPLHTMSTDRLPIPIHEGETLYGYYDRLCKMDHSIGYFWSAQAFAGFSIAQLEQHIDAVMAGPESYDVLVKANDKPQTISVLRPQIFPAQAQLIKALSDNGIEVWVVSASAEELVRLVVSHPKYGINVKPEQVIGVTFLLNDENGNVTYGAKERAENKVGLEHYFSSARQQLILTHHLFAPATWYGGKLSAIKEWIHPSQRPILAAGDSANDQYMLFYVNVERGGHRILINRADKHVRQYAQIRETRRDVTDSADQNPDKGWLTVTAEDLGLH
jgi:phosphorylcholine phosphatase